MLHWNHLYEGAIGRIYHWTTPLATPSTRVPLRKIGGGVPLLNGSRINNPGSPLWSREGWALLIRLACWIGSRWCSNCYVSERCQWKSATCERDVYYISRKLCGRHYALARRQGVLDDEYPKPVLDAVCKAEGCTRPRVAKGYCHGHYVHHEYRGLTTPMGKPKHFLTNVDLGEETATCALCGKNTPVLISYRRGTGERYARMCLSLYPGVQERALNRLVESSYVLTATEREALLAQQGGVCANPSCDARDDDTSRWTRLATDHDHQSTDHAVRGLLCRRCNASIGMAPGDGLIGVLGLAVHLARHEVDQLTDQLTGALRHLTGRTGEPRGASAGSGVGSAG